MKTEKQLIGSWYEVQEIAPDVFWIKEPGLVSFYLFKDKKQGLFIDTGLGLSENAFKELLSHFDLTQFEVICTHAHCDHIGFNSFARICFISQIEFEKFKYQNEDKQLKYFLENLNENALTPLILQRQNNKLIGELSWNPTGYLSAGDIYNFSKWSFEVIATPGHTSGSLSFYERSLNYIFVGDLVYSGTMYLHLKDSDNDDFANSLDLILSIIDKNPNIKIWPAHNEIPLNVQLIEETREVFEMIQKGLISSSRIIPKDKIFEEGQLFISGLVKIIKKT
jgi:glyoxylase-like metal-dependent hydrolase (beta-lactamase superfamily II)